MSSEQEDVVLSVCNVSKCFEMYEKPVHRLYQTLCAGKKKFYKEFWALRDVNFNVHRGECVGIVGKNGAGKSTLLQIITGTLSPTTGSVATKGRVAALLELGSGFNPEFTGRENVFLNGAILGLSQDEIAARYDEIVAFADIGEFIDQPVKTYSSGMMVRLAFAVQVMVEPDILIVDEALSVGDAAFQRKCYARMDMLRQRGVTMLFVTHDTGAVKERCARVIFLKDHAIAYDGDTEMGVTEYMRYLFPLEYERKEDAIVVVPDAERGMSVQETDFVFERTDVAGSEHVWGIGGGAVKAVRIYGLEPPNILKTPRKIRIEVQAGWDRAFVSEKIQSQLLSPNMMIGIRLSDARDIPFYGTNNCLEHVVINPFEMDEVVVSYELDLPALAPGPLFLTTAVAIGTMENHVNLMWNDLVIELLSESLPIVGGVFHCETRLSARGVVHG